MSPAAAPTGTPAPHPSVVAGRLTAWIAAAIVCSRATVDPDLWGHLRFGLDLLRDRRLTAIDPYSFTQDVPWINHEWLSELLFALAYQAAGVVGLLLLKTAILLTAFVLLAGVARRGDQRCTWWVLAVCILGVTPAAITFRPQLWTILGLAILAHMLAQGIRLRWLALVFVVWANMHGGWIVGAAIALLWALGRMADTRSIRPHIPALAAIGVAVLATIVNPYGWRLWTFLLSTVRFGRDISEWRPLWEGVDDHFGAFWPVTVGVIAATVVMRWRTTTWSTLLPVAWLGVSGLMVTRVAPLFNFLAILAVAEAWRTSAAPMPPATTAPAGSRRAAANGRLVVDIAAVLLTWCFTAVGEARCLSIEDSWMPDLAAAGALAGPAVSGRLIVAFNWGEYAIWHWAPRLRVSIDGRRETVYSEDTIARQIALARGRPEDYAYLEHLQPDYVWLALPEGAPVAAWLAAHGYRVDLSTERSFVAVKSDRPPLTIGVPASACFP